MDTTLFRGGIPALMTPCSSDRSPNFTGLVRKARQLVEAGMTSVVYCGSMGDWPLLSDADRQEGVHRLVDAGVPVIVGTGAASSTAAAAHASHAARVGAGGLMVIPRLLSRATSPAAQRNHFARVLGAAAHLPAVIYNSPYYGFETKAELFFDLRDEFPNLVGFKEFGGQAALSYAAEQITHSSDDLLLLVGVDTQVFHGFVRCGAVGAITGVGNCLPGEVLHLLALCRRAVAGDATARRQAAELDDALRVLASFDEDPDLVLYYKFLLTLLGDAEFELHFNESDRLGIGQRQFAETQLAVFQRWWSDWSGREERPHGAVI